MTKPTNTQVPNPTGKGGFQERPEDRGRGFWKREATPRYKLEQMMKLDRETLQEIALDEAAPLFERKIAVALAEGNWKEIESMINQVYGTPKQTIEQTVFEKPIPLEDLTKDK